VEGGVDVVGTIALRPGQEVVSYTSRYLELENGAVFEWGDHISAGSILDFSMTDKSKKD
jgi:hypothetical protein